MRLRQWQLVVPWLMTGALASAIGCDRPEAMPAEPEVIALEPNTLLVTQEEASALDAALEDVAARVLPTLPVTELDNAVGELRVSLAANDATRFARAAVALRRIAESLPAETLEAWRNELDVLLHTVDRAELGVPDQILQRARLNQTSTKNEAR